MALPCRCSTLQLEPWSAPATAAASFGQAELVAGVSPPPGVILDMRWVSQEAFSVPVRSCQGGCLVLRWQWMGFVVCAFTGFCSCLPSLRSETSVNVFSVLLSVPLCSTQMSLCPGVNEPLALGCLLCSVMAAMRSLFLSIEMIQKLFFFFPPVWWKLYMLEHRSVFVAEQCLAWFR